jgi:hypothetical protein
LELSSSVDYLAESCPEKWWLSETAVDSEKQNTKQKLFDKGLLKSLRAEFSKHFKSSNTRTDDDDDSTLQKLMTDNKSKNTFSRNFNHISSSRASPRSLRS